MEEECFGEFPIRTDITILPANSNNLILGFKIYEYNGFELYFSVEDAEKNNPIFDFSALQVGQTLYANLGWETPSCIGTVAKWDNGDIYIDAGGNIWTLEFSGDDRACWVASTCCNKLALEKLNLT